MKTKDFDREKVKEWIREIHGNITRWGYFAKWHLGDWLVKRFKEHNALRLYKDPLDGLTDDELKEVKEYFEEWCKPKTEKEEIEEMLNAPPCCGGY